MNVHLLAVAERLAATSPEWGAAAEYNGDNLSYPVGHNVAVEVEYFDGQYQVWLFAWDRTHGLSAEEEVGVTEFAYVAATLALGRIARFVDDERKMIEALDAAFGPGE